METNIHGRLSDCPELNFDVTTLARYCVKSILMHLASVNIDPLRMLCLFECSIVDSSRAVISCMVSFSDKGKE